MFWRYHPLTSRIETLLENESVTLKELMDEDDILQECKGQNHKLIEFLIAPAIMEELVKLITTEPSPEIDDKIKYKYPNIACELLTSDVSQILDKIVEDNILLDKIYSFLLDKNALNPLLASFFTKVLGLLLARKTTYIFEYLKSKEGFIGSLLAHINTSAVMDLLMRLVTCESYETKPKILTWLDEQNIVERLVDLIHPSHTDEIHFNASTVLCDIVRSGREQLGLDQPLTDPLMDKVESVTTLSKLLCNMLDGEKKESVIVNGLSVLQTILEYRRQLSSFDDWRPMSELCNDQLPASEIERMEKAQVSVTTALKPRLADAARLLTEPPPPVYAQMETTVGLLNPPLGNTRLQVAKLFATLFAINDSDLHICLIEHDVVNKLLDLFFHYVWNNFLHTQVELSICNLLLRNSPSCGEFTLAESNSQGPAEEETPLIAHLFKDCKLVDRMLKAWQENDKLVEAPKQRRGYMGHVTKICNHLLTAKSKGPFSELISKLFSEMPSASYQEWESLVNTQLAEANKRNTSDLVGGHPLTSSSGSDSDSDFKDIPFPQDDSIQQAFSDYQMQQLTSNFIDQFGLGDQEFKEPPSRLDSAFTHHISSLDWSVNPTEENPKQFEASFDADIDCSDEEDDWKDKEVVLHNLSGSSRSASAAAEVLDSESDDSSDEDLPSEVVIKSQPDVAMDVDQHAIYSIDREVPAAMDTSPWDTTATKAGGDDEEWTPFDSEGNADNNENGGWADFSSFNDAAAQDGGPRVSSPDILAQTISLNQQTLVNNTHPDVKDNSPANDNIGFTGSIVVDTSLNESLEQAPLSDDDEAFSSLKESNSLLGSSKSKAAGSNLVDMEIDEPLLGTKEKPEVVITEKDLSDDAQKVAVESNSPDVLSSSPAAGGDNNKVQKKQIEANGPSVLLTAGMMARTDVTNGPH